MKLAKEVKVFTLLNRKIPKLKFSHVDGKIVRMSTVSQMIYRFGAIPVKVLKICRDSENNPKTPAG